MKVAGLCVSVLGTMIFLLGVLISSLRTKTEIFYYADSLEDPTSLLTKAVRALANTAEFAPILAIMFLYLGANNPADWVCWTIVVATASRVLMVVGFLTASTLRKIHPLKALGAMGTYASGLLLCWAMILSVVR